MIYLSDDYLMKYIDTIGQLFGRAIKEGYSYLHIERRIAYSQFVDELEKSNVTSISFVTADELYKDLFPDSPNNEKYIYNPYDVFGWLGFIYIHLFFKYQITFELIFIVLPIEKAMSLYKLYHDRDITNLYEAFEESVRYYYLNEIIRYRDRSTKQLSEMTGVSFSTIQALRYKKRDINKTEIKTLLKLSNALNVKITSLIENLNLTINI